MRFSALTSAFIGGALVAASPVVEHRQERSVEADVVVVRDIKVVHEDCEVVTPKVFIISMVCFPLHLSLAGFTSSNNS